MKSIFFVTAMLFSSLSFAGQRVFDCQATKLSKSPDVSEDFNIQKNPTVLLIEDAKNWSLNVGDYSVSTLDKNGPALARESSAASDTEVRYDFWVEASYEFELVINVVDHTAKVYWWGLGEQTEIGTFQCEVSVK
ncbi:hypothetical protein AB1A81_15910 [Bdellovibrio bacteriovorus]|uniref:Uncharacterized protein n=1 Tax=Bdellovibrio bacteriovorus (strain ATCC 15356 / DSM 50701 / NCIMB 9529 / HD100) TaxID=264462 RepID=Q6MHR8_BDEBA|nr:hypothetical protein [Bdellovibrio bacteriovorus]CAE78264.1 hypothetical protein Bd3472 [Bdellovibrio bacteriovorus HD100]